MYGSLKTAAGASWPERIAVFWREKVVRRALAAPQRAPRRLARLEEQRCSARGKPPPFGQRGNRRSAGVAGVQRSRSMALGAGGRRRGSRFAGK